MVSNSQILGRPGSTGRGRGGVKTPPQREEGSGKKDSWKEGASEPPVAQRAGGILGSGRGFIPGKWSFAEGNRVSGARRRRRNAAQHSLVVPPGGFSAAPLVDHGLCG